MISLRNHFLIATPSLMDPYFTRAVIYLFDHTPAGASGLVINQPLFNMRLGDILEHLHISPHFPGIEDQMVLKGGPLHLEQGFILHTPEQQWLSTQSLNEGLCLTTSLDILEALAKNQGPKYSQIVFGYSSWDPGQLEEELAKQIWLHAPAKNELIFQRPLLQRWRTAAALMGVDVNSFSDEVGHA